MDARTEWLPGEIEDAQRIGLVYAKRPWPGFEGTVQEYRQIEADLIARPGIDTWYLLELRRRIAEWIVNCAWRDDVPFEQFQEAWNGLLALGFTDDEKKRSMTWYYADYCLSNKHYDAGLAVFEPVLAQFEQWLQTTTLETKSREFAFKEIHSLRRIRDGLVACKSSDAEGIAWYDCDEAEYDARDVNYMERDGRDRELDIELNRAMDSIRYASWPRIFSETARDYRQLETDFVARLQGTDEFFVVETKRRIRSAILMDAHKHKQPFDVCGDVWNELEPMEFNGILQKCAMAWFYSDCCSFNKAPDAGLAVVEPLIAELQKVPNEDTDADELESYQAGLARLERLRDKLKTIRQS
jgi:hypothetical protein